MKIHFVMQAGVAGVSGGGVVASTVVEPVCCKVVELQF